jgi:hypothetical protein
MIVFIAPYTFKQFGTTGNTALSLVYTLSSSSLHTHQVSQSSLVVSWQQSHCHIKSHMKSYIHGLIPFLPLFCNCQINSIPSSHPGRLASRNSTLQSRPEYSASTTRSRLVSFYNTSARTTQRTQPLVLGDVLTGSLPSNRRPSVARVRFAGIYLPSRCLAIGIHVTWKETEVKFWLWGSSSTKLA